MATTTSPRASLVRFAWLSIAAAVATMSIKAIAWVVTDSVGLLSDALESSVNLVAAIGALVALTIAARPADDGHRYGHAKAEYFSALAEGLMIMVASALIAWTAIDRLMHPRALDRVGIGVAISMVAAIINLGVSLVLTRAGRRHRSITLEADGKHLMTDVWTSAGVVVGVGLVAVTGIDRLDPVVALLVAANIVVSGLRLVIRSTQGLMDAALPQEQQDAIAAVLDRHRSTSTMFHGLRTRRAGHRSFMSVHVLVPGAWSVQQAHNLLETVEAELRAAVEDLVVTTHVEPLEDPRSFTDQNLDRSSSAPPTEAP